MNKEEVYSLIEDHYKEHHKDFVKRFANIAGGRHASEDVVHNAYLWCLENWEKYIPFSQHPDHNGLQQWFHGVLRNSLRDFKRDERNLGMVMVAVEDN